MAITRTIDEAVRPAAETDRPNRELLRSDDEAARLGNEIYERDVRPQVEAEHHGEFVAIDLDSGRWEVAGDHIAASRQLRANQPGAIDVWCERVGYPAVATLGGWPPQKAE